MDGNEEKKGDDANGFEEVVRPLIKWLNDNHHPHVTVIVTPTSAELVECVRSFVTEDYIRD